METVDMLISVSLDFYFIYWIERFNKQILILNFKAISTTISPFEENFFQFLFYQF
jgi:hypothetical protein